MSSNPKTQTTTTEAIVPEYLKPFVNNLINTGNTSLNNLSASANENLVAPFNANQIKGQKTAIDIANGAGGYIPDAVNQFQGTLRGNPNTDALTSASLQALTNGATQNVVGGSTRTLDQISKERLSGPSVNALSQFASTPFQLNQDAQNALQSGARGDYLYGNPAFDEAVQASIRAARPNVLSGFANAGAGGVSGGLSQVAQQQVASDAFARLFDSERNRQLQSANQLGNFQLAGNDQQIGAATNLGGLTLQDKSIRSNAASNSGGLKLAQQHQNTSAGADIGGLLNAERDRQMKAAQLLPNAALIPSNILNQTGGIQQDQAQNEISAPLLMQQQLFENSLDGLSASSLYNGQKTSQPLYRNRFIDGFGGALTGYGVADALELSNPWKTAVTVGGGLLSMF